MQYSECQVEEAADTRRDSRSGFARLGLTRLRGAIVLCLLMALATIAWAQSSPPSPPLNLVATGGWRQCFLTWDASASGDAASYQVFRAPATATPGVPGTWSQVATNVSATSLTNAVSGDNQTWYYRVRAVNFYGNSDYSNVDDAVTLAADTTPPTVSITSHVNNQHYTRDEMDLFAGNAADTGNAGLDRVALFITRTFVTGASESWDGTNWIPTPAGNVPSLPTTLTPINGDSNNVHWQCTANLPADEDLALGYYTIKATAYDKGALRTNASLSVIIVGTDRTKPTLTFQVPVEGANMTGLHDLHGTVLDPPGVAPNASPDDDITGVYRIWLRWSRVIVVNGVNTTQYWNPTTSAWGASYPDWFIYLPMTDPTAAAEWEFSGIEWQAPHDVGSHKLTMYVYDRSNNGGGPYVRNFNIVAPPTPTGLAASPRALNVDLTWPTVTNPAGTGGAITGYRIERKAGSGAYSTLTTVATPGYTDSAVTAGTTYTYRIFALDGTNAGAASNEASATPIADSTAPTVAITNPTSLSRPSTFTSISGTATEEAGGSGIQSIDRLYLRRQWGATVEYWTGTAWTNTVTTLPATLTAPTSSAPNTWTWTSSAAMPSGGNLQPSYYTIAAGAKDWAGNLSTTASIGFYWGSDTLRPTTTITKPANGTNITSFRELRGTVVNDVSPTGDTSKIFRAALLLSRVVSGVTQYWDFAGSGGWLTASNGGVNVYPVLKKDANGNDIANTYEDWSYTGNLPTGANAPVGAYDLRVTLYDRTNNYHQIHSAFNLVAPPAPTNLTATAAAEAVTLGWTAPVYPAGTEGSITSYRIERKSGTDPFTALVTTSGTSYTDEAVTAGTAYTYRVLALDGTNPSAPSNEATATPSQVPLIDLSIRNQMAEVPENGDPQWISTDGPFTGGGAVNASGNNQVSEQGAIVGQTVRFEVQVVHNSENSETLALRSNSSLIAGWNARYYDGASPVPANEITQALTSSDGWATTVAPGPAGAHTILVVLTAGSNASALAAQEIKIESGLRILGAQFVPRDAVLARAALQRLGKMEYTVNGADWTTVDGDNVPTIPHKTLVGFRAAAANDTLNWPNVPNFKPEWTVTGLQTSPETHIGQTIWVQGEKLVAAPGIEVKAECGNTITTHFTVESAYRVSLTVSKGTVLNGGAPASMATTTATAAVCDADGVPVAGKTVHFKSEYADGVPAGTWSTSSGNAVTDVAGKASLLLTSGSREAPVTLAAEVVDGVNVKSQAQRRVEFVSPTITVKAGAWGISEGVWTRTIRVIVTSFGPVSGRVVNLTAEVKNPDGIVPTGITAPLTNSSGTTDSSGTFNATQSWIPTDSTKIPSDFDVTIVASLD